MDRHANHFPLRYFLRPRTQRRRLKYHAVFWSIFIAFHLLYFAGSKEKIQYKTTWVIAYSCYYLRFIPVYYLAAGVFSRLKEKYYGESLMVLSAVFMALLMHTSTVLVYFGLDQRFGLESLSGNFVHFGRMYLRPPDQNMAGDWLLLLIYDVTESQILFLPLGLKMIQYGFFKHIEKKDMENNQLKIELAIRRTQTAPHFVVNILNSLVSELLPISEKAASYLISLTDVLRFTLYDTVRDLIPLQKEWRALVHFVNLEAERFNDRLKVSIRKKGKIPADAFIPALVLFTLVENAFKHGVYATIEDCWIDAELQIEAGRLQFKIANSKPVIFSRHKSTDDSGIGLDNIKRRLEISSQGQYILTEVDTENQYCIELSVPVAFGYQYPGNLVPK